MSDVPMVVLVAAGFLVGVAAVALWSWWVLRRHDHDRAEQQEVSCEQCGHLGPVDRFGWCTGCVARTIAQERGFGGSW